jgi:hypothetical protein
VFGLVVAAAGGKAAFVALDGAHERNRTFDLLLTKEVLYRLSYVSETCIAQARLGGGVAVASNGAGDGNRTRTISLEG